MLKYLVIFSLLVGTPAYAESNHEDMIKAYGTLRDVSEAREILSHPHHVVLHINREDTHDYSPCIEFSLNSDDYLVGVILDYIEAQAQSVVDGR